MLNPNYHVPWSARRLALPHSVNIFTSVIQMLGWPRATSWESTSQKKEQVVHEYQRCHGEFVPSSQDPEDLHQPFMQDAFIDALVDLIASEDLVSQCCYSRSLFIDYKTLTES